MTSLEAGVAIGSVCYGKDFLDKTRRNTEALTFQYLVDVEDQVVDGNFFRSCHCRIRRRWLGF